mmetsp:Transcript_16830/g.51043  ORF Transcript_16830/g.51043 Transcript_16830/m.51043 type:complete len:182 (+) Transcript_16830:338-883(+)
MPRRPRRRRSSPSPEGRQCERGRRRGHLAALHRVPRGPRRRLLQDYGADVNQTKTHNNTAPLYIACLKSHLQVVRLLLESGAEVNQADDRGATALGMACFQGYNDIARSRCRRQQGEGTLRMPQSRSQGNRPTSARQRRRRHRQRRGRRPHTPRRCLPLRRRRRCTPSAGVQWCHDAPRSA